MRHTDLIYFAVVLLLCIQNASAQGQQSSIFSDTGKMMVGMVAGDPELFFDFIGHSLSDIYYMHKTQSDYNKAYNYFISGNNNLALTFIDKSFEDFEKITDWQIAQQSQLSALWSLMGAILTASGQYGEALLCLDNAIHINPENKYAWYNKGVALYNMGKYDEAIDCYDSAIAIDPSFTYAYTGKNNAQQALQGNNMQIPAGQSTSGNCRWIIVNGWRIYQCDGSQGSTGIGIGIGSPGGIATTQS